MSNNSRISIFSPHHDYSSDDLTVAKNESRYSRSDLPASLSRVRGTFRGLGMIKGNVSLKRSSGSGNDVLSLLLQLDIEHASNSLRTWSVPYSNQCDFILPMTMAETPSV